MRILVVGAGAYQVPAIKRAIELGFEVFCVDGSYIGRKMNIPALSEHAADI